eukprot:11163499-Lingulodinium_polyedra.AAC.1
MKANYQAHFSHKCAGSQNMVRDCSQQGKIEEWLAIRMPLHEDSVSPPEPFNVLGPQLFGFYPQMRPARAQIY